MKLRCDIRKFEKYKVVKINGVVSVVKCKEESDL